MTKNSIGKRFNSLTVLNEFVKDGERWFTCRCDCGTVKDIRKGNVTSGSTKACGCKQQSGLSKLIDRTGQRYGKLTVLRKLPRMSSVTYWECQCDCGKIVPRSVTVLRKANAYTSCGCSRKPMAQKPFKDLTGKRFGRLVALEPVKADDLPRAFYWKCKCDCGNTCIVSSGNLQHQASCGCGKAEHMKAVADKRFGNREDLTGKRFNHLVVNHYNKARHRWVCTCDCGNTTEVSRWHLVNNNVKACGCLKKGRKKKV